MNKNNELKFWQFLLLALFMSPFLYMGYLQNKEKENILKNCSKFTIANPVRMPDSHKVYFTFEYNNRIIESSTSVGAQDLGFLYTKSDILKNRFWVQFSCTDLQVNKILWDKKVPDTLKIIPIKGWSSIPNDY